MISPCSRWNVRDRGGRSSAESSSLPGGSPARTKRPSAGRRSGGIEIWSDDVYIEDCVITRGQTSGMNIREGSPVILNTDFIENGKWHRGLIARAIEAATVGFLRAAEDFEALTNRTATACSVIQAEAFLPPAQPVTDAAADLLVGDWRSCHDPSPASAASLLHPLPLPSRLPFRLNRLQKPCETVGAVR